MNDYVAGSTSIVETIFLQDSASTVGAGKTGLAYNTGSLTCYYKRSNGTAAVAVTLADITTLGTFVSGGFKEIDATHQPGLYEFHPPDAALAAGAKWVAFYFVGAAGLVARVIKVRLLAVNPDNATTGGLGNLNAAIDSRMASYTQPNGFLAATFPSDPADQSLVMDATTALLSAINALNNLSAGQVRTELSTELGRIDATVSSRAAPGAAMTLEAGERTSIGTAVWSSATRTLTSFGSLITDIWSNVTRTLTSGGGGGSTTVVVAPVVGTIQFNTITSSGTVQAFQYCPLPTGPITLVDGNDDPVDVSGGAVKMICTDTKDASKSFTLTTAEGDGLTVGGDNGNQISVDYLPVLAGLYERKTFHKPVGGQYQVREFGFWNIVPGPDPRDA